MKIEMKGNNTNINVFVSIGLVYNGYNINIYNILQVVNVTTYYM